MLSEDFQDKYDLSSVEGFGYGGQIVPRKTIRSLLNAFPSKFAILVYASVEVLVVGIQPLSKNIINSHEYGQIEVKVKVIDEDGLVVPFGTKGEICVRGTKTFKEYLGNPEATSKAKTKTGWVFTQDFGIMYEGGKIKVLGRESDIILRGKDKLLPVEFEDPLLEHPDVTDAVVVGVPDKVLNQELCACVIEVPGSDLKSRFAELEEWCNKKFSSSEEAKGFGPKYFVFMDEFPLKESSKIDRRSIEQLAAEKLGLQ
jgi:acyl-coenzyme A synthetase/AMP-(fatty) acid ligase